MVNLVSVVFQDWVGTLAVRLQLFRKTVATHHSPWKVFPYQGTSRKINLKRRLFVVVQNYQQTSWQEMV